MKMITMKGTRTYQMALICALIGVSTLVNFSETGFNMHDLSNVTNDATELLEVGGKFYLAFLVFWKLVHPYPMKHEKTREDE